MIRERATQTETIPQNWPPYLVVAPEYPRDLARERKREQLDTCQGIDDIHGLPICVFEIVGIGGRFIPASRSLGFSIDNSHYSHNKNSSLYYSKEATRCQCLACHLLYTRGIGHFSSEKKINKRSVYLPEARNLDNRNKFRHLDVSLRYPKDALDALTRQLSNYGVKWEYSEAPFVPEDWYGPGKRDYIEDIAKRLYAPKALDVAIWNSEI